MPLEVISSNGYGVPAVSLRYFTVYGPRQHARISGRKSRITAKRERIMDSRHNSQYSCKAEAFEASEDIGCNPTEGPTMGDIINKRFGRRDLHLVVDCGRTHIERAYRRAGFSPNTVGYFEGHGTGTSVGDLTEMNGMWPRAAAASSLPAEPYLGGYTT